MIASRTDFANIQSPSRRRTTRFGQNKAHGKNVVGGVNTATVQPNQGFKGRREKKGSYEK